METNQNPLLQALTMLLAGTGAVPGQPAQQQSMSVTALPYGCNGKISEGMYTADDVNLLTTWDNHVVCKNGGTYGGVKILFIDTKPTVKSDKSFSKRNTWMARFEISKTNGRNPMNEVINIFVKNEHDYLPYMDPAKWAVKHEHIEFRSEEDGEPTRGFKINSVYFCNEIISDDLRRKCVHLSKRLGGMYECYVDDELFDLDAE